MVYVKLKYGKVLNTDAMLVIFWIEKYLTQFDGEYNSVSLNLYDFTYPEQSYQGKGEL